MSLFDQKVRVVSEGLARGVDRRGFLQKTGSAIFAGVAALAAGHAMGGSALAAQAGRSIPNRPRCAPPGPFCNIDGNNEPNGCHGAQCFQHRSGSTTYQCKVYYQFYAAGCWTTVDGGGYWTCCDCTCGGGGTCGCAQYSMGPVPLPAGQG
ncbi:MAG TPA: hypothetical protein VGE45_15765 [Chloroflexia bacterium]|jgi:hypothetical protein